MSLSLAHPLSPTENSMNQTHCHPQHWLHSIVLELDIPLCKNCRWLERPNQETVSFRLSLDGRYVTATPCGRTSRRWWKPSLAAGSRQRSVAKWCQRVAKKAPRKGRCCKSVYTFVSIGVDEECLVGVQSRTKIFRLGTEGPNTCWAEIQIAFTLNLAKWIVVLRVCKGSRLHEPARLQLL